MTFDQREMDTQKTPGNLIAECEENLQSYWKIIKKASLDQNLTDDETAEKIALLLRSKTKTYRYVLPTQILAKVTDPSLDCRCIQVGRKPERGNFDARSLNEKVIIPFERENGRPLGGSTQPYVNNPLRVPEISSQYRAKQKNQKDWMLLSELLEHVERINTDTFTIKFLKQILMEIRRIQQEQSIAYPVPHRISLEDMIDLLNNFFLSPSGGARLQAVSFALFLTLKDIWGIYDKVYSESVTAPDTQAGRSADIDCIKDGETVIAVEVKDRTVTLELLEDKISTSRLNEVKELLFLIRSNQLVDSDDVMKRGRKEFGSGLNVYMVAFAEFIRSVLVLMGEKGRNRFLITIGHSLEQLRVDFVDRKEWAELLSKY